jgi:hypothetical protein
MRDIPVFTTENGVASLALKEIPYKGTAYITIQDSQQPAQLLRECVDFCKMAGAEQVYATGHPYLEKFPLYTSVLRMQRPRDGIPETDAALFPVTEKTIETFRRIYNEKMFSVPNAATMTKQDAKELLTEGTGYFVHRGETLLGIGVVDGDMVKAIASCIPGAGYDVMLALCSAIFGETVTLEVASNNHPARKLYEKLGFVAVTQLRCWYDVKNFQG